MAHQVATEINLTSAPPANTSFPSSTVDMRWSRSASTPEAEHFTRVLSAAVDHSIMPAGMTQVKRLLVRVYNGNLTIKLTSAAGTAQIVPCDEVFYLESTTQPLTAITVSGTASVEVFAAGE